MARERREAPAIGRGFFVSNRVGNYAGIGGAGVAMLPPSGPAGP